MMLAPNVKKIPEDPMEEVIIFAGADAWTHARDWQDYNKAGDSNPPIVLDKKQLAALSKLRIVDDGRRCVRVYRAGVLTELQISEIATKLAQAGVREARFYSESKELLEDWTRQLARIKHEARAGISAASVLENTGHESLASAECDPLEPHVASRDDGIFWITPKIDKRSGKITNHESWLASPMKILGVGWHGNEQYLIIRWHAYGSAKPTIAAIPKDDIGDREGWRTLKRGGVDITNKPALRAILGDWMQRNGRKELWTVTNTTGWHAGAYIMPDGEIIGEPDKPILFNGRSASASGYAVSGTAEGWRNSVARLAAGNPSMMLGIAVALAAPLIGLVGADGFGVHLYELSSAGKTTTANIASSLWGEPDAMRLTWYGTALGIANEAEAHNDSLLPLDEIGQGSGAKDVATSAYTLFNGTGKLQGAKDGGNRELKRWRTIAISTGEMDIETFLRAGGLNVKAGQLVRLLNIPMQKATVFHEYQTGKQHADALRDAWQSHHGAAGRAWVKFLAANPHQAQEAFRTAQERWRELIPPDYGEQVHRVAARFAVLEAALLLGCEFTGWDVQMCKDAIQHNYKAWLAVFGTGNKEHQQIVEQAVGFLNAYGSSKFAPMDYDPRDLPISEIFGYRDGGKFPGDPVLYYVLLGPFKELVAKGYNKDTTARILHEAGILKKSASTRGWQTRTPRLKHQGDARQWAYCLHFAKELERDEAR